MTVHFDRADALGTSSGDASLAVDARTMIVLALVLLALMGSMYVPAVRRGAMAGELG